MQEALGQPVPNPLRMLRESVINRALGLFGLALGRG